MSTEKIVAFVRDVFQIVHEKRRRTLTVLVASVVMRRRGTPIY